MRKDRKLRIKKIQTLANCFAEAESMRYKELVQEYAKLKFSQQLFDGGVFYDGSGGYMIDGTFFVDPPSWVGCTGYCDIEFAEHLDYAKKVGELSMGFIDEEEV